MQDFLVVRLLHEDGLWRADCSALGLADMRHPSFDTPLEHDAIAQSCKALNSSVPSDRCMRLCTIVRAVADSDARRAARLVFEETVDVLDSQNWGGGRFELYEVGFSRRLRDGMVFPHTKGSSGIGTYPAYLLDYEFLPAQTLQQFLLRTPRSELATRIIRAMHWLRVGRNEASKHRSLLFRWFAIEAIWKNGADDDVVPFIMWALGFPRGQAAQYVRRSLINELQAHATYASWGRQLQQQLDEIRSFRHDSVHSGFREQDIDPARLRSHDRLMTMATARVLDNAEKALLLGATTRAELGEYLPVVFESSENLTNDVHGTIIYSLEKPR